MWIVGVTSKTYDKQSVADSSDFGDCSANSDTKAATETDVSYSGGMEPGFAGMQTDGVAQVVFILVLLL